MGSRRRSTPSPPLPPWATAGTLAATLLRRPTLSTLLNYLDLVDTAARGGMSLDLHPRGTLPSPRTKEWASLFFSAATHGAFWGTATAGWSMLVDFGPARPLVTVLRVWRTYC